MCILLLRGRLFFNLYEKLCNFFISPLFLRKHSKHSIIIPRHFRFCYFSLQICQKCGRDILLELFAINLNDCVSLSLLPSPSSLSSMIFLEICLKSDHSFKVYLAHMCFCGISAIGDLDLYNFLFKLMIK